jgi:PKD repeat protein
VVVDKPNGSDGFTQSVLDNGLFNARGVAVDASGHEFIAETGDNQVVEHAVAAPVAEFTSAQNTGSLSVAFTDTSMPVTPATVTGWSRNFGDDSPASTQRNPSHNYGSTGTYTVTLTVTDSTGKTATFSQPVVVATPRATLTYPAAGQTNVSTLTPFRWTDIPAGQGYQIWIGTSPGDGSLVKSGPLSATTSSYKAPALPTGGELWARLYTEVAGNWGNWQDTPFNVTANRVAFTYPTAGQQNINPIHLEPRDRVPALPTGQTLYARIYTGVASGWGNYQDITFTTPSAGAGSVSATANRELTT